MLKMTALHWAAQHGHHGVAETLIKHGADVHALSKFDKTPFDIAVDIQNTELMLLLQVRHEPHIEVTSELKHLVFIHARGAAQSCSQDKSLSGEFSKISK